MTQWTRLTTHNYVQDTRVPFGDDALVVAYHGSRCGSRPGPYVLTLRGENIDGTNCRAGAQWANDRLERYGGPPNNAVMGADGMLRAVGPIARGDEITWDYGPAFWGRVNLPPGYPRG
jgi:hypothetical protein